MNANLEIETSVSWSLVELGLEQLRQEVLNLNDPDLKQQVFLFINQALSIKDQTAKNRLLGHCTQHAQELNFWRLWVKSTAYIDELGAWFSFDRPGLPIISRLEIILGIDSVDLRNEVIYYLMTTKVQGFPLFRLINFTPQVFAEIKERLTVAGVDEVKIVELFPVPDLTKAIPPSIINRPQHPTAN